MNSSPQFEFAAFFTAKLKERGISLARLAELSGISPEHLTNLLEGDVRHLPPAPYLRGYLLKLGKILGFDGEEWWNEIKTAEGIRSAEDDALPKNRFAVPRAHRFAWLGVILAAAIVYLVIRLPAIVGTPTVVVTSPAEPVSRVAERLLRVAGTAERADGLFVNREKVPVAGDGSWEKMIPLDPGPNPIEIRAKKLLGQEIVLMRQVVYEPPAENATSTP